MRGIDCSIPHRALTVVTGVSGSGKSSLAFDTLYAEGHRRYVQTFSSYSRQFLERLPRPPVDAVHNLLPTIGLAQHNGTNQPRSSVGTLTEVDDYLGLLLTALGTVHCPQCGQLVQPETATSAQTQLEKDFPEARVILVAERPWDPEIPRSEQLSELVRGGYRRIVRDGQIVELEGGEIDHFEVLESLPLVIDRLIIRDDDPRLRDSLESAFRIGRGEVRVESPDGETLARWKGDWSCNRCGLQLNEPTPPLFSFNTPLGACSTCSGFGKAMGISREAVVPDPGLSLSRGAIVAFAGPSGSAHRGAMLAFCERHEIPTKTAWARLTEQQQTAIFNGDDQWKGVLGYFDLLKERHTERDAMMHVAKFRAYTDCASCNGSRYSVGARNFATCIRGANIGELAAM
ncbi:MAG: hypothetical protein KC561_07205, partial [Myxococcales bacterium]|nr:hypothetical protein [Myxococcales bacterium]